MAEKLGDGALFHSCNENDVALDVPARPYNVSTSLPSADGKRARRRFKMPAMRFMKDGDDSDSDDELEDTGNNEAIDRQNSMMLGHAIENAGRWAFGTVAVEAWVLSPDKTKIIMPENGFWVDKVFNPTDAEALERLTDSSREDYLPPPEKLSPGEGLAGCLWEQTGMQSGMQSGNNRMQSFKGRLNLPGSLVVYRDIKSIVDDPFQHYCPRMQVIEQAGLGLAAGVPFNIRGKKGIVLFFSRKSANLQKLKTLANQRYLLAASDHIGSVIALKMPLIASVRERRTEGRLAFNRVINHILTAYRFSSEGSKRHAPGRKSFEITDGKEPPQDAPSKSTTTSAWCGRDNIVRVYFNMWAKKAFGGTMQPPPPMPMRQAIWTFVGVFLTMIIVHQASISVKGATDEGIIMGPIAAFACLLFALTAGPPSQPRNAILGYTLAALIGLMTLKIPGLKEPSNLKWRHSLSVSLSVVLMVRLGLIHPPAAAGAVLFSTGNLGWQSLANLLVGYVLAILMSSVINNANEKRQYPTYWLGFALTNDLCEKKEKRKE